MIFRTIAHAADIVSGLCRLPDTSHDIEYLLDRDKKALEQAHEKAQRKAAEAQQWTTLLTTLTPLVLQILNRIDEKPSYHAAPVPKPGQPEQADGDGAEFEEVRNDHERFGGCCSRCR